MRKLQALGLASIAALSLSSFGCHKTCADSMYASDSAPRGSASDSKGGGFNAGSPAPSSADAARAVAEADIIQMDGDRLYAMSKSGSVAIVDVSNPAALSLLGKATLSGEPFEMYRSGNVLLTMSNGAVDSNGTIRPPARAEEVWETQPSHDNDGAVITALDVSNAQSPRPLGQFVIPGQIADSRMIGTVLYIATYENAACYQCGTQPKTTVTSFDMSDPTSPKKIDALDFASNAPDQINLAWGMAWKRSVFANDKRLYIGGHADRIPSYGNTEDLEGIVDVIDITDPTGHLVAGAHLTTPGAVLSRWQMDETDGVFRVISQHGAGVSGNGYAMPEIDTFTVNATNDIQPLGHATISLPRQEGLRTVRFDGNRAYAITFNQTDPLFALDFTDPANPRQRGELHMPGWMFYLEPHGDRVIGLGVDRTDPEGSLNVSLFDVANMDSPTLIKRVSFGGYTNEDYEITNYELPEDQDRIQKAFRVFDDGVVAVPFSGSSSSGDVCTSKTGGIQLINWKNDTLSKATLLSMAGNPRRAFEHGAHIVGVSDSNVTAFEPSSGGKASSDLVIGTCVSKPSVNGNGGWGEGGGDYGGYGGGYGSYGGYGEGYDSPSFGTCE